MSGILSRLLSPSNWAALIGAVALLTLTVFVVGRCSRGEEVAHARADKALAEARTASAAEAITEIGRLGDRGQATEIQVKEAQNAVLQAPPDDRDRVARHRLCSLQRRTDCDRLL